jgi:hypothetical protein
VSPKEDDGWAKQSMHTFLNFCKYV